MRAVTPITITDSNLTSSSIAEPDAAKGEIEWAAGTYNLGDQRIKSSTHLIYEVVADPNTADDPEVGIVATPATWVVVGPTNRYAMFDDQQPTVSNDTSNIVIDIAPGERCTAVASFGVSTAAVNVTATTPGEGEVYNTDISMIDESLVIDWLTYFTNPVILIDRFVLLDLPLYLDMTITVTYTGTNNSVGTLVLGDQIYMGDTQYGTSGWKLMSFATVNRDAYGNYTGTSTGNIYDATNYQVQVNRNLFNYVVGRLKTLTGVPAVFVGNESSVNSALTVYGVYNEISLDLDGPNRINYTIKVDGIA